MSRVVLVRHALPIKDPKVGSEDWALAEGADEDCVRLGEALSFRPTVISSSTERKAFDTATCIATHLGIDVRTDGRFGEVRRPYTEGDYRAVAIDYLRNGNREWEPRATVLARFTAAVDAVDASVDDTAVIVNHGLAMSLYIASVADVDVVEFWGSLTFPDAWSVDLASARAERVFEEGRPAPA